MARILIIDDDADVLRSVRRILEVHGHTVLEASEGKTALRRFAGDPADLVLTDIFMPEMDGIELIMKLKGAFPESRIVAMSGGGAMDKKSVLGAASMLGVDAVLEKPFEMDDLVQTVERILTGE